MELLEKIKDSLFFQPQTPKVQQPLANAQHLHEALEPKIKLIAAKLITNPTLCRYLNERKIPLKIAENYCKEVHFDLNDKSNFAIGFENKSGGFELRNSIFKGSSSPKDVTRISFPNAKDIAVFEGFFSFLSYQTLHQKDTQLTDFLVLNSLAFFEKSREIMEEYQKVHLYLDRDKAGITCTENALKRDVKYTDKSNLYRNHKDLNDYLISQDQKLKQSHGQRLHL